jgi:hypothetical protein
MRTTTVMGIAATSALPTLGRNIAGALVAFRVNIITRLEEAGSVPVGHSEAGLSADDSKKYTRKAASVGGLFFGPDFDSDQLDNTEWNEARLPELNLLRLECSIWGRP